jgi:hypothetical protein
MCAGGLQSAPRIEGEVRAVQEPVTHFQWVMNRWSPERTAALNSAQLLTSLICFRPKHQILMNIMQFYIAEVSRVFDVGAVELVYDATTIHC